MPTSAQIDAINDAYAQTISTQDPRYYYQALSDAGIYYGSLALGVVNNNSFAGIVANNFAENKIANDFNSSFSASDQSALMLALAAGDYQLRSVATDWQLTGEEISNYHDNAFGAVFQGLPGAAEAWTPYYQVRALNDYEFWLPSGSWDPSNYLAYARMHVPLNSSDPARHEPAIKWFQDMELFLFDFVELEFIAGDNVLAESMTEWAFGESITLDQRSELLLDGNSYKPTAATDVSGFLGYGIHTLFINEMLQKIGGGTPTEIAKVTNNEGALSFDPAEVTASNIDVLEIVSHTLSTVNALDSSTYALDWYESPLATIVEAFYGANPYAIGNLDHAILAIANGVTLSGKSNSFVTLRGDVEEISISDSNVVIVAANSEDNVINLTNVDEGIIYAGGGDDVINISGASSNDTWYLKPLFLDTGAGNDTLVFNDTTPDGQFYGIYVMAGGGGQDKVVNNAKQSDLADPLSDYYLHIPYIMLDGILPSELALEKTLVDQRQITDHDQTTNFDITLVTEWYDVRYVLKSADNSTSIDLGTYSFAIPTIYSVGRGEGYADSTVTYNFGNWNKDSILVDGELEMTKVDKNLTVLFMEDDELQIAALNELVNMEFDPLWIV